jgi:hypothetical protein
MNKMITRRDALKWSAASLLLISYSSLPNKQIIDSHNHFYDLTRPEGVPWPSIKSSLYRKVEPSEFEIFTKLLRVNTLFFTGNARAFYKVQLS